LIDGLKPEGKALDIGCGSGYVSAMMAEALGPSGKVFTMDHIQEINDLAKKNIMKSHKEFLENDRITFYT